MIKSVMFFPRQLNTAQRGALWMLVAGAGFAVMGALVKLGSRHFSTAELVFYRSFISLLVLVVTIVIQGHSLRTPHLKTHLQRSLSGSVALMMSFYAVTQLPLATATTLNYTSSIFLAILTVVVFKRRPPLLLIMAVLLGFFGVICLLKPSLDQDTIIPAFIGLTSGFLAAIAYLNVKALGQLGEPGWRVVFYFTLTASLCAFVLMLFDRFHAISLDSGLILAGIGGSATIAQLALTKAYKQGKPLVVASLAYSTVVFSTLISVIFWGESLVLLAGLGILLVIASGVLSVFASKE